MFEITSRINIEGHPILNLVTGSVLSIPPIESNLFIN